MPRINSILIRKYFDLNKILNDPAMILQKISEKKEYKDGKYTDKVVGYKYDCVETMNFDHLSVYVEGDIPLMTNERLQELRLRGEKVWVEFEQPLIMAYYNGQTDSIVDTIKAKGIHLVETDDV
ncbi:hypothetical protein HNP82_001270 [Catenibacillus scindens]|uniref:Uncharacterized protein n=1 Tax=Catenibacillus scindens TaxID=673271 RepID=A0A7W8H9K5_9FIRM|nr:hypothetical protein [Catenibacillus scindens]MBB5264165.1 hypothetical protein [Catenibacillus scindens]